MKRHGVLLVFLLTGSIALFFVAGILWFGGIGSLLAFANGKPLYLSPCLLDLGFCEAGLETVAVFQLHNLSSKEISVTGERSNCNCAFSEQLYFKRGQIVGFSPSHGSREWNAAQ